MDDYELREALNDCIDRLAAGQNISDCLRRYPEYAPILRPLLEVGNLIDRTQASPLEIAPAQARVRAQVNARLSTRPVRRSYVRLPALVASLLLAFAVLFGAAENSLPGDTLYGVKRFTESVRSTLIGEQFTVRRLDEIHTLEALQRPEDVQFGGQIEQITGTRWRVAGLDLHVAEGIADANSVVVGDTIRVSAHTTTQGNLVASAITLLNKTVAPLVVTATVTPPVLPSTLTPTPPPTICTPALPSGWVRYIVQPGNTVSALAAQIGASVEQVMTVNCLPATRMIIVGQTLFLPMRPPSTPTLTPAPPTQESSDAGQQSPQPTIDHTNSSEDHGSNQQTGGDG